MNVLVLGAGGFLGLNIVDALVMSGVRPRCGRRKRSNVIPLRSRKVPMVLADLDDAASLSGAMADVDVVVHAAGHYPRLSLDYAGSLETGMRQLENTLDAAAAAGVRRLIYVSTTATVARADGASTERDVHPAPPGFGTYHDLKWHMEARALAETRFEVVVACPSACLGPWDLRVGTSALLVATARGLHPPHPDGVVNLVDARDVGKAIARLAAHDAPPERVILSAENHRLHSLLRMLARRYGVPPPSTPLTDEEAIRFATEEERAHQDRRTGRPALSREIVDLIVHGVPVDASLAEEVLDMRWRPLAETLDAFDEWARRMRIIPEPGTQQETRP